MAEILDLELAAVEGPMKARLYRPTARRPARTLVYLHGGGWALLGIDTHDRLMREYAAASGWAVIGLDYPRAPETVYPHISEACLAAIHDLRERSASLGLAAERMVLGGDSSGANLAAALALAMRDAGHIPALGMLLNYGVYDCDLTRPSYRLFSAEPFQLTCEKISWFWRCYCRDETRRREPLASPLRAHLAGLPPAHLVIAGRDILHDENEAFAAALEGAGISVSVDRYPDAPHAFLEALTLAPISQVAIKRAAQWLQTIAAD